MKKRFAPKKLFKNYEEKLSYLEKDKNAFIACQWNNYSKTYLFRKLVWLLVQR